MTMKNADFTIKNIMHRFIEFRDLFKVPKCALYIYTTKSLWVSDLAAEIKNSYFLQLGFHFAAKRSVYF